MQGMTGPRAEARPTIVAGLVVGQLDLDAQFALWALRQRHADGAEGSPILRHGFRLAFGLAGLEPALASFERWFATIDAGRAICPLRCACLSADETMLLAEIITDAAGQPFAALLRASRLDVGRARPPQLSRYQ
jgi:hypothetical protein